MPSIVAENPPALPGYRDYRHVVVAVIENDRNELLLARRHDHQHQGGLWEFPGGKVNPGESAYAALERELHEELVITPVQARPLIRIPYEYPDRKLLLDVWRLTAFSGEPQGAEGQSLVWVHRQALTEYSFPAANRAIVSAAQLPSRYLITPDPGPFAEWPVFLQQLRASLKAGNRLVQLRAPTLERTSYLKLAQQVLDCCEEQGATLLLNGEPSLLDECDAAGIHLNSTRLMKISQRPLGADKLLAASCHNAQQLSQAEKIDVDFALLSPVKPTASHPEAQAIGWENFHCLSEQCRVPLYALGGMSPQDLPEAWRYGAQGIAAIRSLWGAWESEYQEMSN